MIPNPPHRRKGGAPQLGASVPGEPGPFGTYADEDDEPDEPVTESTSHVEQQVQQRIEAAERKTAARRRDRAAFAAARSKGLARRHAAKLRYLAERDRSVVIADGTPDTADADEQPPDDKP